MNQLNENEISKYNYLYENHEEDYGQTADTEPRFMITKSLIESISNAKTVFDAGVGRGGFYNIIKKEYSTCGIEASKVAVDKFHSEDKNVKNIFIQQIKSNYNPDSFDVVTCLDVLEHIPESELEIVFSNLLFIGKKYFIFSVANHSDIWNGQELHITQLEYDIWESMFEKHFKVIAGLEIHNGRAKIFLLEKNEESETTIGLKFSLFDFYNKLLPIYNSNKNICKNATPLFTIVIPTYNQAGYLGFALDSVLNQTIPFWEAIIVNDGSTDNTKEVIDKYLSLDKRFRVYHKENGGVASALNVGIKNARGEWICWLSSDDLFEPDKLFVHAEEIKKYPQIKFFYSHYYYFNDITKEKTHPGLWQSIPKSEFQVTKFLLGNYVHGNSIALHKSVFEKVGLFDISLRQAQDFDMWLRISAKFVSHYINRRTCVTRFHPGQDTNAFPDGMYFDSARACINFLNRHKFEELYPLLNLRNEYDIKTALIDSVEIALNLKSFMYKCGYIPALIDRMNEWIQHKSLAHLKRQIKDSIKEIINELTYKLPDKLTDAFNRILQDDSFSYKEYDLYEEMTHDIEQFLDEGDQKNATNFERYLHLLFTRRETKSLPFVVRERNYSPKIYDASLARASESLPYDKLTKFAVNPFSYEGKFLFNLEAECQSCKTKITLKDFMDVETKANEIKFVCYGCGKAYKISDGEIGKYFLHSACKVEENTNNGNKIAFIARGLSGKSGGTIIFTKYMQWLDKLGFELTVFCDTPKGDWTYIPGKYVHIENYDEFSLEEFSYIFLYSILDLSKIIKKINPGRIIYVCQAYEGFLYGETYENVRTDKPFFNSLHKTPIKVIAVSKHLQDFFKNNFGIESFYVPNFVDLNIFKPDKKIIKEKNTILFIGNPFQNLKGLNFLMAAVSRIQNLKNRIPDLKVIIAVGIATKEMKENMNKIREVFDCEVIFLSGLSSERMSELINMSSVYVCSSWYEGFSLSVLEAMACGTPLIATRNMGVESFCTDGENSFLINYGEVDLLADKILAVLKHEFDNNIPLHGLKTASEYSEENSFNNFTGMLSELFLDIASRRTKIKNLFVQTGSGSFESARANLPQRCINERKKLSITYLVSNISAVTGGNQTLLYQANTLVNRGHRVVIVSYKPKPQWYRLNAEVITVPESEEMYKYVPASDVVIATYFLNAHELKKINAPLKIYFAQGDQYAFNDELLMKQCKKDFVSAQNKTLSKESYHIDDVKVIANSEGFAELLKRNYSRVPDAILNVGVDPKVFCPLQKSYEGSTKRILVVGPDNYGTQLEPLHFKGMDDVKAALTKLKGKYPNFTLVRVSNTTPEIFKDFECEFYYLPNDELKKYLYGTADILIYASHYESLGLPPLEAMAAGTAVICTNNVGSREYCHNRENCLLVNTKSPEEISQALLKLLRDKDLSDKIINGGKFTSLLYTKEREIEKLENIIYDFLAEKGFDVIDTKAAGKNLSSANFDEALKLVNEYISNKNFEDAMTQLDFIEKEISEGNGNGIDYLEVVIYLKGVCHLLSGNIEEAKSLFEQLLNVNPASSSACYGLGQIFLSQELYEQAKVMFEWSIKNDPKNQIAIDLLAKVNALLGLEEFHNSLN